MDDAISTNRLVGEGAREEEVDEEEVEEDIFTFGKRW
jgi:hypothetical protein